MVFLFNYSFLNHDNVKCFISTNCGSGLESGRWFLSVATWLTGSMSNLWMQGMISGAFIGLIVIIIVNLFHIKDKKNTYLIALAFVAFPSVAFIYTYMFTSSQYFLSVFLAVAGAYLIIRRKWAGAILLAFSIGIYQAFVAVALSLLLLSMITDILQKRVSGMREIGLTTIRYGICVLLGLLIYILILKTMLWMSGATLTDYQGIGSFSASNLFSNIPLAYENFFSFFEKHFDLRPYFGIFVSFSDIISIIFLGIAVYRNKVYRSAFDLFSLFLLVLLIPLVLNVNYLFDSDMTVIHDIMVLSMVFRMILPLLLVDCTGLLDRKIERLSLSFRGRTISEILSFLLLSFFFIVQIVNSYEMVTSNNVTYAMSEMTYSNAISYYNRICSRIEEHDAFEPDIKIALIGSISFQNKIPERRLTGALVGEEAFNMYSRYSFYHNYLGATYNWATTKEISNIAGMEEFKNMPIYPRHGSIRKIGEYLVVKFSDYE